MSKKDEVVQSRFILEKIRTGENIPPSRLPSMDFMRKFVEKKDALGHKRNGRSRVGSGG